MTEDKVASDSQRLELESKKEITDLHNELRSTHKLPRKVLAGRQLLPREWVRLLYDRHQWVYSPGLPSTLLPWTNLDALLLMAQIIPAESAGYTEAEGPVNANGTQDFGIFQLNSQHASAWGFDNPEDFKAMAFDPFESVVYARALWADSVEKGLPGSQPWYAGPEGNGSYARFEFKVVLGICNFLAERDGLQPVPFAQRRPV